MGLCLFNIGEVMEKSTAKTAGVNLVTYAGAEYIALKMTRRTAVLRSVRDPKLKIKCPAKSNLLKPYKGEENG
jgi:hypothetical protein